MKANELRIGNLVNHSIYGECEVTALDYEMICIQRNDSDIKEWFDLEDYEPITLTEEWLLKFGFEKKGYEWELFPCFEIQIIVFNQDTYNGVMFYTRTIHTDYVPIYCLNHINCVHQLQNLYFALTNEELTFKDEN